MATASKVATSKSKGKEKKVKPSAAELLARMGGKKKMEPSVLDAIDDIEAARVHLEKLEKAKSSSTAELQSASGGVFEARSRHKQVAGMEYKPRPAPMWPADDAALMAVFNATHGNRWACARGWRGRAGATNNAEGGVLPLLPFEAHASHWFGVQCEVSEIRGVVVVELSLPDNDLDGFLPPEIAEMPALRHLELPANLLSGPLPDGVFNALPLLEILRLQMNQLSGPIGPSLGLPASDAEAWGIPRQHQNNNNNNTADASYGDAMAAGMTSSTTLEREPRGDYHQRYIKELTLSDNCFSGAIPPGLLGPPLPPLPKPPPTPPHQQQREGDRLRAAFERFKTRHHHHDHHHHHHSQADSGDDASIGSGGSFDSASASIDESQADYHSAAGGGLSLALQEQPQQQPEEENVEVQALDQELTVPRGLTPDQENAFRQSALFEGRAFPHLLEIDLSRNRLTGAIPNFAPLHGGRRVKKKDRGQGLRVLRLAQNRLTGALPPGLSGFMGLKELDLGRNALTGPLPAWLTTLRALDVLDLSRNQFRGPLPASMSGVCFPRLQRLCLQQNHLTGPLPPEIGTMARLSVLNFSHNALTGRVPDNITLLTKLTVLLMHHNEGLLCPMPPGLTALKNLVDMCLIDGAPSNSLAPQRRHDTRRFKATRVDALNIGLDNWHSPG